MKLIDYLREERGRTARLGEALCVASAFVSQMASGARPVAAATAVQIERETALQVRRWDLRPNDWHLIWPELIGMEGAPPVVDAAAPVAASTAAAAEQVLRAA